MSDKGWRADSKQATTAYDGHALGCPLWLQVESRPVAASNPPEEDSLSPEVLGPADRDSVPHGVTAVAGIVPIDLLTV